MILLKLFEQVNLSQNIHINILIPQLRHTILYKSLEHTVYELNQTE